MYTYEPLSKRTIIFLLVVSFYVAVLPVSEMVCGGCPPAMYADVHTYVIRKMKRANSSRGPVSRTKKEKWMTYDTTT